MAASYISVPRDLTKVKSKVMFNLTKRQLICFGMAVLIGVPSFFLMKTVMKTNTAVMGMMVIMMPFFFLAMYEKNGQPLEVILNHMIQAIFKRPKIRPYKTDNYYAALLRQAEAEEAARIDGANSWQLMRYIILPLMMPAFTIGLFLSISSSFKMFDQNLALTQGGPYKSTEMIALNIYNSAFGANEFGFAQAKAIVFLIIVAGIGVTQLVITKRKEVEM